MIWQSDGDRRSAALSECGTYRYVLRRVIAPGRTVADVPTWAAVFLMLNPSDADGLQDDPTVTRCIHFTEYWNRRHRWHAQFSDLFVVNFFGLRSPHPKALLGHPDPVGPENELVFGLLPKEYTPIVAAWGASPLVTRAMVSRVIALTGQRLWALDTTADGSPKHPLARGKHRIPNETGLSMWNMTEWKGRS